MPINDGEKANENLYQLMAHLVLHHNNNASACIVCMKSFEGTVYWWDISHPQRHVNASLLLLW